MGPGENMRYKVKIDGHAEVTAPEDPLADSTVHISDKTVFLDGPITIRSDGPVGVEIEKHEPEEGSE
jgi:hypothetical protein